MIRHLAKVERIWFRQRAAGEPVAPMYDPARGKGSDFYDAVAAGALAEYARHNGDADLLRESTDGITGR